MVKSSYFWTSSSPVQPFFKFLSHFQIWLYLETHRPSSNLACGKVLSGLVHDEAIRKAQQDVAAAGLEGLGHVCDMPAWRWRTCRRCAGRQPTRSRRRHPSRSNCDPLLFVWLIDTASSVARCDLFFFSRQFCRIPSMATIPVFRGSSDEAQQLRMRGRIAEEIQTNKSNLPSAWNLEPVILCWSWSR